MKHFKQSGLHPTLVQTVADLGYETPTPIQAALIPLMLSGRDVIGQAQTGTGKTAAFTLPTLHRIEPGKGKVQALVLAPTRELAVQVSTAMYTYGRELGVSVLPVYGGTPYTRQINRLRKGVDIVVGTPGRLLDLIQKGALDLSAVSTVVLDEADEMLSMGFAEDLEAILSETPEGRQTALLSATMPQGIRRIADQYMRNPEVCKVAHDASTAPAIEQRYIVVKGSDKTTALTRLLETEPIVSALVFAHTRVSTAQVAAELGERGYSAEVLNGELSQSARDEVLGRFRSSRIDVLVATDVAARGLDIDHVSHVFNYDLPRDPEIYVHRIGRTGRAGKEGVAIALVTPNQRGLLKRIESYTKQTIEPARLPTPSDIERLRQERFEAGLTEHLANGPADRDLHVVTKLASEGHDPVVIAAAALALARAGEPERPVEHVHEGSFGRSTREPKQGKTRSSYKGDGKPARQSHESGMVRLALQTGRTSGIRPGQVVSALARHADMPGKAIGKILIEDQRTLVDVPQEFVPQVLAKTGDYRFGKDKVEIERA